MQIFTKARDNTRDDVSVKYTTWDHEILSY